MIESIIGLAITFAICYGVLWLVGKIGAPAPWDWIVKAIVVLILILWVLQKYGIYTVAK